MCTSPPNTTSLIQPMDQDILENIKRRYKRGLLLWLLDDEVSSMNIAEFSKTLNIKGRCFDVCKELE